MDAARRIVLGCAALLIALPGSAHHSTAMFDLQKRITVAGTVKQFQWTNPHCWIQLMVSAADDATEPSEWSIEMASPIQVFQGGWKPTTLKPGDKIMVTIHPARDGGKSGIFISATGAEGQALGKQPSEPQHVQ
jgi:Family of unknown function (DUF6152)